MERKDHLKFMLGINQSATNQLLEEISEEESLRQVNGYKNHIRWEAGHIAVGLSLILKALTDQWDMPEEWNKLFRRGCEFYDDASVYPPLAELKVEIKKYFDLIYAALETVSDDKFDDEIEMVPGWKENRFNGVLFLSMHDFYHGGQIAVLRRTLGKDRTFG